MVKSVCESSNGLEPRCQVQLPITPAPGTLTPSSDTSGTHTHLHKPTRRHIPIRLIKSKIKMVYI